MLRGRSAYPGLLSGTGALNPFTEPVALHLLSLLARSLVARDLLICQVDQPTASKIKVFSFLDLCC
jgi:hypothetical protein